MSTTSKKGAAPAYAYHDMTMCAECAYSATAVGMLLAGTGLPVDMEDAIAITVLVQIERGLEVNVPAAVPNPTGKCDGSCGRDLAEIAAAMRDEEAA